MRKLIALFCLLLITTVSCQVGLPKTKTQPGLKPTRTSIRPIRTPKKPFTVTPRPTSTVLATYTSFPTYTPLPTYTTLPTYTPPPSEVVTTTESLTVTPAGTATATRWAPTFTVTPQSGFLITDFTDKVMPGGKATLTVQTVTGAVCRASYVAPKTGAGEAQSLGTTLAGQDGICYWTWEISDSSPTGAGEVIISVNGYNQTREISITKNP